MGVHFHSPAAKFITLAYPCFIWSADMYLHVFSSLRFLIVSATFNQSDSQMTPM